MDVEDTRDFAMDKGLQVFELEGQSRRFLEPYPLNQIKIKGRALGSNVKVIVSPYTSQIYFSIEDAPGIDKLENLVENLWQVEQILNEVVVFVPDETVRFNMETRTPVMSIGMLKVQYMLKEKLNWAFEKLFELILTEISHAFILSARGKPDYAMKRMDALFGEFVNFQRNLIQMAKDQGIEEAEKCESELNEMISQSKRFEAELAFAKSPSEFRNILDKYLSKASEFGN